jgi:dienelactone hydrolase
MSSNRVWEGPNMRSILVAVALPAVLAWCLAGCSGGGDPADGSLDAVDAQDASGEEETLQDDGGPADAEDELDGAGGDAGGDAGEEVGDDVGQDGGEDAADGAGEEASDEAPVPDPGLSAGAEPAPLSVDVELPGCLPDGDGNGEVVPLQIYLPEGAGPFPVVVLHHGFQLDATQYATYGAHLAGWGYLAILPKMPGALIGGPNHRELKLCLESLLDWIEAQAAVPDGPLLGKADPAHLGLAGHSMGGKISLLVASEDSRPLAVFGIDPVDAGGGPLGTDPVDFPSVTPELMGSIHVPLVLLGETTNATCTGFLCQACAPAEDNFQQYFDHAASPALEIEVVGANHMSFLDDPDCGLTCSVCADGTDDPRVTKLLTRRYLTAFMNVVLRGQDEYRRYLTGPGMQVDIDAGLVHTRTANGF